MFYTEVGVKCNSLMFKPYFKYLLLILIYRIVALYKTVFLSSLRLVVKHTKFASETDSVIGIRTS